jgi:hypothetical protein
MTSNVAVTAIVLDAVAKSTVDPMDGLVISVTNGFVANADSLKKMIAKNAIRTNVGNAVKLLLHACVQNVV